MQVEFKRVILIMLAVLTAASAPAQEPEVVVGEIDFPQRVWGMQTLPFEITNNTDWLKFLIVETDVAFEGSYVNPHRIVRTNFALQPLIRQIVDSKLDIPANYGKLTMMIRIYDVVDTLDDLSLGTVIFEQPFMIRFPAPDAVVPYFQERITLPPLVGNHGLFDNEFARLMLLMLNEGKTIYEIASICQADTGFARELAEQLVSGRFARKDGSNYAAGVPIISLPFAQSGRELADRISDRLTATITANLGRRRAVIDSLKSAGVYSGDSTNFTEGGTLLFKPYALIGGLYLWQVLGQKFITGPRGLQVFAHTDPCNAKIGPFMYLVQGGDYFNGHHFFMADPSRGGYDSRFGDSIPEVVCRPGFEKVRAAVEGNQWNFAESDRPDMYIYDSTFVNPMLRTIDVGVDTILQDATSELRKLNEQFGGGELSTGTGYWFWNLTASLTLDKLTRNNVVARSGNGMFRFREKTE